MSPKPVVNVSISGEEVIARLLALGVRHTPVAYEVMYAHMSGADPALSRALTMRGEGPMPVDDAFIAELHALHLADDVTQRAAERSSRAVMMEINSIIELVRISLGANSNYGEKLSTLLADVASTNDPAVVTRLVQTLVSATNEVQTANKSLEKRLHASRAEIDELRNVLESTRLETLQDALTGISNRKHFEQVLQEALRKTHETRTPFSLLLCDIDFFKHFNDRHGHMLGDKVLRVVAQTLREKFRANATVARYGGEEFAVIIEEADLMAGWIGAEAARQTILARELVKRSTGEKLGRITVSIGVACCKRIDTRESLLARADAALLRAKAGGRNRTVTEDQLQEGAAA